MKRRLTEKILGLMLIVLSGSGCIFGGISNEVRSYDLERDLKRESVLSCRINFALFRNLSGSDRRFLERHKAGRMQADEFNRWILDPELLLERYFRGNFRGTGKELVRVRGVITSFEIDMERKEAVLEIDFMLFCDGRSSRVLCRSRQKIGDMDRKESFVRAMSRCAADISDQLKRRLIEFSEEK